MALVTGTSAPAPERTTSDTSADIRNLFTERSCQIDLMVLLLDEDLSNLLRHRVFAERFALADAIAIVANRLVFIVEVEPEHRIRILRCAYRLRRDGRHLAEIVDLPRDDQRVIQFLLRMEFELRSDIGIRCARKYLRIHDVRDDRLVFA